MNSPDAIDGRPSDGLHALLTLARLLGKPVAAHQIPPTLRDCSGSSDDLARVARALGLRLESLPAGHDPVAVAPCLVRMRDRGWILLARGDADRLLVHESSSATPEVLGRAAFGALWTGQTLRMVATGNANDGSGPLGLRWILSSARPYRALLLEVVLASAVVQLLGLIAPLFFQAVIDKVLVHQIKSTLQVIIIGLLLVSVFETLLGGVRTGLLNHTTSRMDVALGARLYAHLMALPLGYFEARRVGDVVARVRELDTLRAFVTGSGLTLVLDLCFALIVLAVMYAYSPMLTGVVALSLPAYLLVSLCSASVLREQVEQRFRCSAANQSFLVESISGASTVKAMALEHAMQRRWERQLADHIRASFRVTLTANMASHSAQLIQKLTTAAVLWFGAAMVISNALSVGELIAFNLFAARISAPALRLFQVWQDFQQARVSLARLGDIMNTPPEATGSRMVPDTLNGKLRFEHVRFRYQADLACVLDDLSLEIAPGEVVGIVGASGSGKSTLARLVQRLSLPESGRILVDDMDLRMISPGWLRDRIGVVPQETFLFNASVRDNIAPGDTALDLDAIVEAARLAGAHEFICGLPSGYDTVLGEHAHNLSGGQRQRLAIARALVRNPRILIFDEATSALDVDSELSVQQNIARICAGRTAIIIAHRLSSLQHVHRILVLDSGRVIEQGTPQVLASSGGVYARMLARQSKARVAA